MLKNKKEMQLPDLDKDLLNWFYDMRGISYQKQDQLNKLYTLERFRDALKRKTIKQQ
jgi:hypothetical protein